MNKSIPNTLAEFDFFSWISENALIASQTQDMRPSL